MKFKEIKTRDEFIDTLPVMNQNLGDVIDNDAMINNFITASKHNYRHFAAYDDDRIVAVLGIVKVYSPNYPAPAYDINHFTVDENYRRKGVGSSFLEYCRQMSLEEGASCLRLATYIDNYPVLAFYQKNGFKHTANFMFLKLENNDNANHH